MTAKKEYWQINTARIADEILAASSGARTEEDLKMRVEPILRRAFKDVGVDIDLVVYGEGNCPQNQDGRRTWIFDHGI